MERLKQIEEILQEALQRDPAGCDAYVHEACGGDAELRREVFLLLANHKEVIRGESWPAAAAAQLISVPRLLQSGRTLGEHA